MQTGMFCHWSLPCTEKLARNTQVPKVLWYRKAGKKYTGAKGVVVQMQQPIGTITALFSTQITDYPLVN